MRGTFLPNTMNENGISTSTSAAMRLAAARKARGPESPSNEAELSNTTVARYRRLPPPSRCANIYMGQMFANCPLAWQPVHSAETHEW
jgi:hypothetical protein